MSKEDLHNKLEEPKRMSDEMIEMKYTSERNAVLLAFHMLRRKQ